MVGEGGRLEIIAHSLSCDRSIFTNGHESQAWSSPMGHICHQHEQRAGEVAVLSQEKAVDMGTCKDDLQQRIRTSLCTFHHSSLFHLGEKEPEGGWTEGKTHRLYFDCISRLLEVTDRLSKILCVGAAGNVKVET